MTGLIVNGSVLFEGRTYRGFQLFTTTSATSYERVPTARIDLLKQRSSSVPIPVTVILTHFFAGRRSRWAPSRLPSRGSLFAIVAERIDGDVYTVSQATKSRILAARASRDIPEADVLEIAGGDAGIVRRARLSGHFLDSLRQLQASCDAANRPEFIHELRLGLRTIRSGPHGLDPDLVGIYCYALRLVSFVTYFEIDEQSDRVRFIDLVWEFSDLGVPEELRIPTPVRDEILGTVGG